MLAWPAHPTYHRRMDFHYRYNVNADPDELWALVSDIPTVGMCIPGASDVRADGDASYAGMVKVRVGPISLGLNGKLTVDEIDDAGRQISLTGEGADRKVPGNVRVRIKMTVEPADAGNSVLVVDSEANIMGKLGEFGQGIIRRKAEGILKDFGENLAKKVAR